MNDADKIIKHIDGLVENLNWLYKEYKREEKKNIKAGLCKALRGCAFGLTQDFNELVKCEDEVAE